MEEGAGDKGGRKENGNEIRVGKSSESKGKEGREWHVWEEVRNQKE